MKILVTGGSSMVGKHLKCFLPNAIYLSSADCDLRNFDETYEVFKTHKPDAIIHLAAKVGGILDNINDPVGFFDDNIYMNTNVIKCAHALGIKKVISVLSTCIYPDGRNIKQSFSRYIWQTIFSMERKIESRETR